MTRVHVVRLDPSRPATLADQPTEMVCSSLQEAASWAIGLGAADDSRFAAWREGAVDPAYVSRGGRLYMVDDDGRPWRVDHDHLRSWC